MRKFFFSEIFPCILLTAAASGLSAMFISILAAGGTVIVTDSLLTLWLEVILSIILALTGLVYAVLRMVRYCRREEDVPPRKVKKD